MKIEQLRKTGKLILEKQEENLKKLKEKKFSKQQTQTRTSKVRARKLYDRGIYREFDPGSGQTLAACLTHASRTGEEGSLLSSELVADG